MNSEPPEIYFLHIPKTAGMSLASIIRSAYPKEQVCPVVEMRHIVKIGREQINNYRCFAGHFDASLYGLLDREIPTVTILRDPFERAVSNLRFVQRLPPPHGILNRIGYAVWETVKAPTVRRILQHHCLNYFLLDAQTRSIGVGLDVSSFLGKGDPCVQECDQKYYYGMLEKAEDPDEMDAALERAKRRLDRMAVVGTVERFDESVRLICEYLGIEAPATPPAINLGEGDVKLKRYRDSPKVSRDLADLVDRLNTRDRELYAYGSALLDARLKAGKTAQVPAP